MSYNNFINQNIQYTLATTDPTTLLDTLKYTRFNNGKVRDSYFREEDIVLITTDRISAFNRVLGTIPFKGQVLNGIANFWFNFMKDIIPNHIIASPDPNITIARRLDIFPVEIIVRAYLTGSTDTSILMNYNNGVRNYCGNILPEDLKPNSRLPSIIVTPTTKSDSHDELISPEEIVNRRLMTASEWEYISSKAIEIFEKASDYLDSKGLMLVDTKMEFGKDIDGNIILADELLTPDSSRYWLKDSYQDCFNQGIPPKSLDKEVLRLWYVNHCDPYNDKVLPDAPDELIVELSAKYIELYELITDSKFQFPDTSFGINQRINKALGVK